MENLVDFYFSKLNETNNPGKVLYNFFCSLFETKWDVSVLKQFHKLVRLYGRYRVFFALLSMYDGYHETGIRDSERPYPLIAYFIKEDLKKSYKGQIENNKKSLEKYVKAYDEFLNKKEKIKVADTFEDDDDRG